MEEITNYLFKNQDKEYQAFSRKLIPNIDQESIIGVRVPILRKYAKELFNNGKYQQFLLELPHQYHEENMLHTFILSLIKDDDKWLRYMKNFLPYISNWATCDNYNFKVIKANKNKLEKQIISWVKSNKPYTCRFGIGLLMTYYLEDEFKIEYLDLVSSVESDEYYVKMMVSWYFATALAKQYDFAIKYIENKSLDTWTHNKTIQKAIESFRVSDKHKQYLKELRK